MARTKTESNLLMMNYSSLLFALLFVGRLAAPKQAELDEIDVDLDQLLDMSDDDTRRRWLRVSEFLVERDDDDDDDLTSKRLGRRHYTTLQYSVKRVDKRPTTDKKRHLI